MKPFTTIYNDAESLLDPKGRIVTRKLSHMSEMYQDQQAAQELLNDDPLVYEVFNVEVPENVEHLQHCLTVLYPGKVGQEYFMTKGHYHEVLNRAEIYFCFKGEGKLVMQTKEGEAEEVEMSPGTIAYVPPAWAHRTVNTGKNPLVFFAAYPGDAGHDYGEIEREGFRKIVLDDTGGVKVVNNPRYDS
ncbi:glucose-6-phosphate isomerase family protein [Bacillus tianshenii]|nr:glucose-6-phosphate isomerase family protein [Bacillus tianshenii]